jgi:glycosyltransferase involved in cell wall biosynthesis
MSLKITVITVANSAAIADTLKAVSQQSYQDFEHLILI